MRIFISSLLLLFIAVSNLIAQPFERISKSKKRVKEIIEWRDNGKGKKATKIGHSFFDRKGRLKEYHYGENGRSKHIQQYDPQGRVIEVRSQNDALTLATFYAYPKGQKVQHTTYRKKHYKTFWYYDKGKLKEEKTFARGEELGSEFRLKKRVQYFYDKRDSLKSEIHYDYPMIGRQPPDKRKVKHTYHSKTGKRIRSDHYNVGGQLRAKRLYFYDNKGRLSRISESFKDGRPAYNLELKYQKNRLWQRIDDYGYERSVRIYKDGHLIRTRSYVGDQLFSLIDYQYKYY